MHIKTLITALAFASCAGFASASPGGSEQGAPPQLPEQAEKTPVTQAPAAVAAAAEKPAAVATDQVQASAPQSQDAAKEPSHS